MPQMIFGTENEDQTRGVNMEFVSQITAKLSDN